MEILNLKFFNFRNLDDIVINFDNRINFFYGKNGQGKTNILEALYFSITGKSFRTLNIKEIVKHNFDNCGALSYYIDDELERNIGCFLKNSKKSFFFNSKKIQYSDFFGKVPVIFFVPNDIDLILSSPSFRRDYFDYEISQWDYNYYMLLVEFKKLLKIRNLYIKEKKINNEIFEIYNKKYFDISAEIILKREEYIKNLSIIFDLNYRKIFDSSSEVEIKYLNFIGEKLKTKEEILKKIETIYLSLKNKELFLGYSIIGPHRDDYLFIINGNNSKFYSSQGEKKSIVFSIKISEIDLIIKNKKKKPILIIDDLSSYFDEYRIKSLISYFQKRKIQLFISSTDKMNMDFKFFYIEKGKIYD